MTERLREDKQGVEGEREKESEGGLTSLQGGGSFGSAGEYSSQSPSRRHPRTASAATLPSLVVPRVKPMNSTSPAPVEWYKWNDLTKASQLDFILIKKTDRCKVNDSKAMPNIHIDTDHRPVMMETSARRRPRPNKRQQPETINLRKLAEEPVKAAIEQQMDQLFQKLPDQEGNTEEKWTWFKDALTDTLKANCGTKKRKTGQVKGTSWWNDTVKAATKEKKRLFKKWSKSNLEADYNEYREARRNCKKTIKEAKDQSWKTYSENLAKKSNSSSREFFKAVKAYKQRDEPLDPTAIINDKDGNPLTDSCEITNRWGEYFADLLNPSSDGDRQQQQPFHPWFQEEVDPPILQEGVRNATKTSPKNKAAGIDDITTEAILACGDTGVKWLTRVLNRAWEERAAPDDWQRAIIVPIWKKKGSKRDCSKYRGISLLSHTGKIYAKILEKRIRPVVEHQLSEAQFGFRKNRGCTDAIFALRQLCERSIEYNQDLYTIFIDQEKAVDRVNRDLLWTVLEDYGVKGQLLDSVRAIYRGSLCTVRTRTGLTKWFPVKSE
ncbi:uncharacterized protein [Amphiura filiformis]|uniref:uncharacterized protein n=1 Tax=Amphiura filiformis TaxID=82378 RepID=UPI003B228676